MRQASPLDALFPKTRQGILAAMLMRPDKTWYASELARRMGVSPSSLQRELRQLTEVGILKGHRQGHMAYYQANTESPVFDDLRGLFFKTAGLAHVIARALKPLASKILWAFIYGSIASGREQSDSDIDLMVIGKVSPADLALPLRGARELLGREINPTVYTSAEFAKKRAANDHFVTRVLAMPKLHVIGSADELVKTTGK
jgi:DNA-binding transcriptional ArsR family regulator